MGSTDDLLFWIYNIIADSHRSLGLGLALCHSIIEAHNGTLILTDHAPHGCNFIFTLPLSEVDIVCLELRRSQIPEVNAVAR